MDEYKIKVIINGKEDILKTYCNHIVSAIDTMINIDSIEDILYITRTKDSKEWSLSNVNMKELRDLRKEIDETLLVQTLNTL